MASKKVIAVVGSTGQQGGGLVRAILREGEWSKFAVRAITRNPNSEKAKELAKLGAEVVQGDINDEASITKAIQGAYGFYCVTLSGWDEYTPEMELRQAANMSKAARNAGIKHVIWSTMEDTRLKVPLDNNFMPTLYNSYKVPFFDAKGESDKLFGDLPTTYLLSPFYWESFIDMKLGPVKDAGRYYLSMPIGNRRLPGIGVDDVGKCALSIFKQPNQYMNKRVGIAAEMLTLAEMAQKMTAAFGQAIEPDEMTSNEFRELGFDGADEYANMFQYLHDFEADVCANRSVELTKKLNPDLMTFDEWLAANKNRIQI